MPKQVTNAMIEARLLKVDEDVSHIRRTTDEMHLVLHGNGKPKEGITSRLTVMETIVERLEKIMWMVAGAVIVALIGAVFAVIRSVG
jgi:hypothetical protein